MANQYTEASPDSLRAKVLQYIHDNPGSTTRETTEGTGLPYASVSRSLTWFRQKGLIRKEIRGVTSACHWSPVEDMSRAGFDGQFCTWRKTWEPMRIPKQGIFAALGI